jgi:DNA-binding CsgD family transcriptional regulator
MARHPPDKKKSAISSISFTYRTGAENIISESEVENYVRSLDFFEHTLRFSQTAFLIIEYNTWSYLYCSSNTKDVLGYSPELLLERGPAFGLDTYHDEDLDIQRKIHPIIVDLFSGLPESEKNRYRFSFTSRMNHGNGQEVMLLQSDFFLKWSKDGRPLLKLITFTDITSYKKNKEVVFYVTRFNNNGQNEIVLQRNFSHQESPPLTPRELDVIQLLSSGHTVADIAHHLSLSVNTVKNHKKNIMARLGCTSSAQAVSLAFLYGLTSNRQLDIIHKSAK